MGIVAYHTGGIAVPHFQVHIWDGLAGVDVDDLVVQDGVDALLLLNDVLANVFAADIVRPLGDVGCQDAARVAAEQRALVRVGRVAQRGGVVVGGQDAVERALGLEPTLGPRRLHLLLAAGDVAGLVASGLELGRAVAEVADLGGGHELTALLELLLDRVAGVGRGEAGEGDREEGVGEAHLERSFKVVNVCYLAGLTRRDCCFGCS